MKNYSVRIVAGGKEYLFAIDTAKQVADLVNGSLMVTEVEVVENYYDTLGKVTHTNYLTIDEVDTIVFANYSEVSA